MDRTRPSDLGAAFEWSIWIAAEAGPEYALMIVRQIAKGGRVKNSNAAVAAGHPRIKGM